MTKRVRLMAPQRFPVARRNSDTNYLSSLQLPGYSLEPLSALTTTIEINAKYAAGPIARRLRWGTLANAIERAPWRTRVHVPAMEFDGVAGVLANIYLPRNWPAAPLIFEQDFLVCAVGEFGEARRQFLRSLDLEALYRTAALVVRSRPSAEAGAALLPHYPVERIRVIPHLMPHITESPPRARAEFVNQGPLRVLFVGRPARRKGLLTLMDAVAQARLRGTEIELTVISDFRDGPVPGLADTQRVFSALSKAQVRDVMLRSHILALPTYQEAFGMVLAEAAAVGCALVFPNFEPQVSVFAGTGLPVPPGDVDALANCLVELDCDRERTHRLGAAGQALWRREFDPKVVMDQYRRLFRDVF